MMRKTAAVYLALTLAPWPAMAAETIPTRTVPIRVETIATGLENPWSVEVLPDGAYLVTERPGRLRIIEDGVISPPVDGLPKIAAAGQGGLLDVALSRQFAETAILYFSFSEPGPGGAGTAIAKARLVRDDQQPRLEDTEVIFSMNRKTRRGQHFGSRIVIADDDSLFFSIGERGDRDRAQDMQDHAGAILHINPDGSIPADNPYGDGISALPELWSKGHRNPQGIAIDPANGTLFAVEHGARGGDEINQPQPGKNYGWPVISYGRHYSGQKIGQGQQAEGFEQPIHYWDPSIAPGALAVYRADMFPEWQGDFLVTALKDQMLVRVERDEDGRIVGEEQMLEGKFGRLRDVVIAPDGSLLLLTDEADGVLLRVSRP
tara:strand:+ start:31058 stop:32185 length:1128 start_codon:yes stop_codon:yes gene_type:complete